MPQKLGPWWGLTNAICCSVNVDGVVILLGGSGDNVLQLNLFEIFELRSGGGTHKPSFHMPLHPSWWEH